MELKNKRVKANTPSSQNCRIRKQIILNEFFACKFPDKIWDEYYIKKHQNIIYEK